MAHDVGRHAARAESNFVYLCDPVGKPLGQRELRTQINVPEQIPGTFEFRQVARSEPRSIWSLSFSADGQFLAAACRRIGGGGILNGGGGRCWPRNAKGDDVVLADSAYTLDEYPAKKGWGHGTFDKCIGLAKAAGVKVLYCTHHEPTRSDDDLERVFADAMERHSGKLDGLDVRLAREGDIVLSCGKGHEQSMCFGAREHLWDDRTAMRAALSELLGVEGPNMPYLPTQDTEEAEWLTWK